MHVFTKILPGLYPKWIPKGRNAGRAKVI